MNSLDGTRYSETWDPCGEDHRSYGVPFDQRRTSSESESQRLSRRRSRLTSGFYPFHREHEWNHARANDRGHPDLVTEPKHDGLVKQAAAERPCA
jgi:hypothetical protein